MDYLLPEFDEYLNEEGDINIAGFSSARHSILKNFEQESYKEAFS